MARASAGDLELATRHLPSGRPGGLAMRPGGSQTPDLVAGGQGLIRTAVWADSRLWDATRACTSTGVSPASDSAGRVTEPLVSRADCCREGPTCPALSRSQPGLALRSFPN